MRTTLAVDDDLLRELKRRAADQGKTLQAVVNELLRQALARRPGKRYRLELEGWEARLHPGVDLADRDRLYDLMDERSR